MKKLKLRTETVRRLTRDQLTLVAGGNTVPGDTLRLDLCNTKGCPVTN